MKVNIAVSQARATDDKAEKSLLVWKFSCGTTSRSSLSQFTTRTRWCRVHCGRFWTSTKMVMVPIERNEFVQTRNVFSITLYCTLQGDEILKKALLVCDGNQKRLVLSIPAVLLKWQHQFAFLYQIKSCEKAQIRDWGSLYVLGHLKKRTTNNSSRDRQLWAFLQCSNHLVLSESSYLEDT